MSTARAVAAFAASLAVAGWALGPSARGQTPDARPATGLVAGTVVDIATRLGIADAIVTLLADPVSGRSLTTILARVMTDSAGRFVFTGLGPGTVNLSWGKPGFTRNGNVNNRYPITLHDGERVTNTTLTLWKYAAISGRVVDELGDPVVGVGVMAFRRQPFDDRPDFGQSGGTDDRGLYRISTLVPGEYIVGVPMRQATLPVAAIGQFMAGGAGAQDSIQDLGLVTPEFAVLGTPSTQRVGDLALLSPSHAYFAPDAAGTRAMGYQTTFAPSTTSTASAMSVTVRSGEDRTGVDVQLRLDPVVRVKGHVTGPNGPVGHAALRLAPVSSVLVDVIFPTATALADSEGAFTFLNVPPGQYVLRTSSGYSTAQADPVNFPLWAEQQISVGDTPPDDVRVTLRRPLQVTGRVEFDGVSPRLAPDQLSRYAANLVNLRTVGFFETGRQRAAVNADGTFTIQSLLGGRYALDSRGTFGPWTLKSAMSNGRDISLTSFDLDADLSGIVVTMTDRPASVAGAVRDTQRAPAGSTTVLLFSVDRTAWTDFSDSPRRLKRTMTTPTGTFRLDEVPEGDYFLIAAVEDMGVTGNRQTPGSLADGWNPALLAAISRSATRIHVGDGQAVTQDLTVVILR